MHLKGFFVATLIVVIKILIVVESSYWCLAKLPLLDLLMKLVTTKIITIFTIVRIVALVGTILVVSITSVLLYLAHTSTPFHKKAKSSPKHTFYTPKTNHEKVTKMVIKFDNNEK